MGDLPRKMLVRAQKRTRNVVGLQNALPKNGGSKAHLKWSEGTKAHSKEGVISIYQWWKQCIMIYMHVYLPEKYRSSFLHGVFLFLKVWSVGSKLRWLFLSCLLESSLVILISGKGLISSYFFVLHPLSQGLPILPNIFLRKGIMEPALPGAFDCPPTWSCP